MTRLTFPTWVLLVSLAALGQEPVILAPAETDEMKTIFNGRDLQGWDGDPRLWSVRDGAIHGETTSSTPAQSNSFLIWQGGKLKDFELRLSFRCNAANNSGIQYRSSHITGPGAKHAWVVKGYQHEIRNEATLPDVSGFIYDEGGDRGRMCSVGEVVVWSKDGKQVRRDNLIDQESFLKLMRIDDWNDIIIVANGNQIQHYLNGRLIMDFTDEDSTKSRADGILALQLHAGQPMWAEFTDVRLRPL